MAKNITARIKNRSDASVNWTSNNPILELGELGLETNTNKIKFGDGVTNWNSLIYYSYVSDAEKTGWNNKADITDFPSSLPANGGDSNTVDGQHASEFYQNGSVIMNTNPFGGKKLFMNSLNDALFVADKRYIVTGTRYNSTDVSLGALSVSELATLFNGEYEGNLNIPANQHVVVNITFNGGAFPGYPYGNIYISHYYTGYSASAKLRVYTTFEPHTVGWHEYIFTDFYRSGADNLIIIARNPIYQITQMEFVIYAPVGTPANITQIDFQLDRPGITEMPVFDKFKQNKLYYNLDMVGNAILNCPTIPNNTNQLTNGSNFITSAQAPVQTVSGRSGTVVLTSADVGLGNVSNTSDASKPVSTATQTALNLKAPSGYGLGVPLSTVTITDSNNATITGMYYASPSDPHKPLGVNDGSLFVMAYSSIWVNQLYLDWRTDKSYRRTCNNGTWGGWIELSDTSHTHAASGVIVADSGNKFTGTNVEAVLLELFTSASDGKTLIASAITGKNVETLPADTYQKMADNINYLDGLPHLLRKLGTPLSNFTWDEINMVCQMGLVTTYFAIGDEKNIVVNGETLTMQIYDFNHDNKTDGTGKASITFGMKNLMATTRQMNTAQVNVGGWGASNLRTWITGTLLGQLPSDLLAVIKPVNKLSSAGNLSATINTTSDKVFLFSEIECFGVLKYSFAGEGSKYPIFTTDASRIKKLANGAGALTTWWNRGAAQTYSNCFNGVLDSNGWSKVYLHADTTNIGVDFGFCI